MLLDLRLSLLVVIIITMGETNQRYFQPATVIAAISVVYLGIVVVRTFAFDQIVTASAN